MRLALPLLLAASACEVPAIDAIDPDEGSDPALFDLPDGEVDDDTPSTAFELAARTFDVPVEILVALSAAETSLQDVDGQEEFPGKPTRFGVMGMSSAKVARAAHLAGLDPDVVRRVRRHQVAAAAALLSSWADDEGIERDDLGAWAPVVARWAEIDDEDAQAHYVYDEVYRQIRRGVSVEGLVLDPVRVTPDFPEPEGWAHAAGAERSYAVWRPSPNTSSRPTGAYGGVQAIVIHTCEGSYSGCWSWLTNGGSGVSAHYVVNSDGSEVSQLVVEDRKAWHVGATYDCDLNNRTLCNLEGRGSNDFTVGIEHAGYASQTSWSTGLLGTSAQLVCDIAADHGVPIDSYHVVAHGRLDPYRRVDPGPNWPWTSYLADARSRCGQAGGGGGGGGAPQGATSVVVDSNNSYNDRAKGYVEVSGNWTSSANVRGYYATGYWWRTASASDDPAKFWFYVPTDSCMGVDAWWPAAADRAPNAPFRVVDPAGRRVATASVDQRINGGRWNHLGDWQLPAGWNRVDLSRQASGGVVIADAVRMTPSTSCVGGGGGGGPVDITVDGDAALNGPAARFEASASWHPSTGVTGYYGSGYHWRETGPTSDPANFWFYLAAPARLTVESRWTAGNNRSTTAPFQVYTANGDLLGTVRVDQTRNHGAWVNLGTYDFPAGWSRVSLSRWTTAGSVVVADAVRVRSAP